MQPSHIRARPTRLQVFPGRQGFALTGAVLIGLDLRTVMIQPSRVRRTSPTTKLTISERRIAPAHPNTNAAVSLWSSMLRFGRGRCGMTIAGFSSPWVWFLRSITWRCHARP